jgi:glycosyltransferase involved in cell wall biosynthesis
MTDSVSAIVTTHLRPALLEESLASVLEQRRRPEEVLVVDDADDLETREVVERHSDVPDVDLRYICNDAGPGPCTSRNLGAKLAGGQWLAFLDDDDVWDRDHLVHCTAVTESVDLVIGGVFVRGPDGEPVVRPIPEGLTATTVFDHRGGMTGSNLVVRRDVFLATGGFDPQLPVFNDWDLFYRFVARGTPYRFVDLPLVEWRTHPDERIATPSPKRAEGLEAFLMRYGHAMPAEARRRIQVMALGIRRRHVTTAGARLGLSLRLLRAHGPAGAVRRMRLKLGGAA